MGFGTSRGRFRRTQKHPRFGEGAAYVLSMLCVPHVDCENAPRFCSLNYGDVRAGPSYPATVHPMPIMIDRPVKINDLRMTCFVGVNLCES